MAEAAGGDVPPALARHAAEDGAPRRPVAPDGRLDWLDLDIARWDYLLSPSPASTPRLRSAFRWSGEVLELGYPRNDVLQPPKVDEVRARTRCSEAPWASATSTMGTSFDGTASGPSGPKT